MKAENEQQKENGMNFFLQESEHAITVSEYLMNDKEHMKGFLRSRSQETQNKANIICLDIEVILHYLQ